MVILGPKEQSEILFGLKRLRIELKEKQCVYGQKRVYNNQNREWKRLWIMWDKKNAITWNLT